MHKYLFLFLALTGATALFADTTEIAGAPNVILSPYTYWSDPRMGQFYNASGVRVGSRFFMYAQGGVRNSANGGPGSECSLGEDIVAFSNPWTHTGLRSHFVYEGNISPCNLVAPGVHYQLGSVFQSSWDGKYTILIDETENGATFSEGDFKRVLIGTSTDGKTWTYPPNMNPFIKQSTVPNGPTFSIIEVALVQGPSDWWGTFNWGYNPGLGCGCAVGRIRVKRDLANPRGFVVELLASDDTWKRVKDDGSFDFVPKDIGLPRTNTLVNNNGSYELWGNLLSVAASQGCYDGTTSGSTFNYRAISETGSVGTLQQVHSNLRPMPSMNDWGRIYPFRMNDMNGKKILYSTSTDRICFSGLTGIGGAEIVLTVVDQ